MDPAHFLNRFSTMISVAFATPRAEVGGYVPVTYSNDIMSDRFSSILDYAQQLTTSLLPLY